MEIVPVLTTLLLNCDPVKEPEKAIVLPTKSTNNKLQKHKDTNFIIVGFGVNGKVC